MKNTHARTYECAVVYCCSIIVVARVTPILPTLQITSDTWPTQAAQQAVSHGRCCNRQILSTHTSPLWSPKGNANDRLALRLTPPGEGPSCASSREKEVPESEYFVGADEEGLQLNIGRLISLFVSTWREQLGWSQQSELNAAFISERIVEYEARMSADAVVHVLRYISWSIEVSHISSQNVENIEILPTADVWFCGYVQVDTPTDKIATAAVATCRARSAEDLVDSTSGKRASCCCTGE